jgi:uroporphyrin-3 C-methyltransferase
MHNMDNETPDSLPATAVPEAEKPASSAPKARPRSGLPTLFVIVVLLAAALAVWWWYAQQTREADSASVREQAISSELADLARSNEQLRRDVDSLRARLADADTVNRGIREELLGFAERSRALEDAVSNLADQRLTSRDALALNEAEFILQLAGERLSLFNDAAAAIAAYRLADSALSSAEDPLFASVRQTIAAEIQSLEAAQPLQTQATLVALSGLRDAVSNLPTKSARHTTDTEAGAERSRVKQILSQFVRISHDSSGPALAGRDVNLTRAVVAIDLRAAEAALFSRDAKAFSATLQRARNDIASTFDGESPIVQEALATLDRLAATPLAPALPELGTALRELRNLRTTRALSREPVPVTQPTEPAPEAAADGGVEL